MASTFNKNLKITLFGESHGEAIGVTIECIDAGLLHQKVSEGGYAVIPGNYALTAWGATKAAEYKVFGESTDVAYPNIIACRTADLDSLLNLQNMFLDLTKCLL